MRSPSAISPRAANTSGLEQVDHRQAAPERELIDPSCQRRGEQRREELRGDEERRRCSDILRAVVHQHGQRDDARPESPISLTV